MIEARDRPSTMLIFTPTYALLRGLEPRLAQIEQRRLHELTSLIRVPYAQALEEKVGG